MEDSTIHSAPTTDEVRTLLQQERLEDARVLCTRLLDQDSRNADAWNLLGTIHHTRHGFSEAEQCFRRTVELQPTSGPARLNLGQVLLSRGLPHEALAEYRAAVQLDPRLAEAYCAMGKAQAQLGQIDHAAASLESALRLRPDLSEAHYYLGVVRLNQRDYNRAITHFKEAIRGNPAETYLNAVKGQALSLLRSNHAQEALSLFLFLSDYIPRDVEIPYSLSILHLYLGHYVEAVDSCHAVLRLDPNHDGAEVNLGHVKRYLGKNKEALQHYGRALTINPSNIAALVYFGKSCRTWSDMEHFLSSYRNALAALPDPTTLRRFFVEVMENFRPKLYDRWLDEELRHCFDVDDISYRRLTPISTRVLKLKYDAIFDDMRTSRETLNQFQALSHDRLLINILENDINVDPDLERILTRIRRELLIKYRQTGTVDSDDLVFIAALAHQCHNNEYVFFQDEEEQMWIDELRQRINDSTRFPLMPTTDLEHRLVVFAMYERLTALACREQLAAAPLESWTPGIRTLLEECLLNPLAEQRLKNDIPVIGSIGDDTSRLVQSQYEENPYPRWSSLTVKRDQNFGQLLTTEFQHFKAPGFLYGPLRILIAGCGTGKHPIQTALSFPTAEITAIDISKSSLAYAIRMARRYEVRNVRFLHADILELGQLYEHFHIVESVGVLHHMKDPIAGWRVLIDLLVDNGLMSIALYSEKGRRDVVAARKLIQTLGLTPAPADIRKFRYDLLSQEHSDLYNLLSQSPDFYSTSGCRDLLFHFMEHRFTVPQLKAALADLGLTFIGFTFGNFRIKASYSSYFPEDTTMTNLDYWNQYETEHPHTFRNMYHFWCQKTGSVK